LISFWTHQQISVLIFLLVILFITLSNIRILRKLGSYPSPLQYPFISVLVPARNEEENIGGCIRSLLNQDYPNFEVIVLDDNSTDRTWRILNELSAKNNKLRILKGEPLPDGWFGKHWACHQLSQNADGEVFLFTDADTRHNPNSLKDGIAGMIAEKADLITAFPREETISWGELIMVPLFPWFILCFLPLIVAYRTQSPAFSAAIGQFLMISREAYKKIGGYEAIRQEAVDDVALARNIKANGLRWRMSLGYDQLYCRMYHGFREAYSGFTKNLFAGFGYKILTFTFVWLCIGTAFLEPIVVLFLAIIGVESSFLTLALAGIGVLVSLLIWGASHWRFGFPIYMTFLYPISVMLLLIIAFSSMIFALTGKAGWKGRYFTKPKIGWL
jgi:chlorobactene glucosyltransferase